MIRLAKSGKNLRKTTDFYVILGSSVFYTIIGLILLITLTYGFWFANVQSKVVATIIIAFSAFVLIMFQATRILIEAERIGFLKTPSDRSLSTRFDKKVDRIFSRVDK